MSIRTGLDVLEQERFGKLQDRRIAVVCNQASVNQRFIHILDLLNSGHEKGDFTIAAVFGPQHGLAGTTQDNMIEWNGEGSDGYRYPVHSLYGEHREPTDKMLAGVELILVDLPDIGSRYYTFIWTMALVMKAAERLGIPILVLDRPNPIGSKVEGTVLESEFSSFVGLHPFPTRHGLTLGEAARFMRQEHYPNLRLDVEAVQGWDRNSYADTNGYAWVMPSPNMPTVQTAVVYPGGCLIEGTNLSEGRGTTRPFETVGAPWVNGRRLANALNESDLPGVHFRPIQFEPTFNKYAGQICNGVFVHVINRDLFEPFLAYCAIMIEVIRQTGLHDSSHVSSDRFVAAGAETKLLGFAWKQPPYEYEFDRLPMDILFGNGHTRRLIEHGIGLDLLRNGTKMECLPFISKVQPCKMYVG